MEFRASRPCSLGGDARDGAVAARKGGGCTKAQASLVPPAASLLRRQDRNFVTTPRGGPWPHANRRSFSKPTSGQFTSRYCRVENSLPNQIPGTRTEFSSRAISSGHGQERPLGADASACRSGAGSATGRALLPGRLSCAATPIKKQQLSELRACKSNGRLHVAFELIIICSCKYATCLNRT